MGTPFEKTLRVKKDDVESCSSGSGIMVTGICRYYRLPYSRSASRNKMGGQRLGAIDFYIQNVFGRHQMHVTSNTLTDCASHLYMIRSMDSLHAQLIITPLAPQSMCLFHVLYSCRRPQNTEPTGTNCRPKPGFSQR